MTMTKPSYIYLISFAAPNGRPNAPEPRDEWLPVPERSQASTHPDPRRPLQTFPIPNPDQP